MSGFGGLVHDSWLPALAPHTQLLAEIGQRLRHELAAGRPYHPAGERILRAFEQPLDQVRVLLMGQDPYPTPGHAVGLSFSVAPDTRPLPRSLENIFTELAADTGLPRPSTGDLSPWAERGVLLLNRVLTVGSGQAGSHRDFGWQAITESAVRALGMRPAPLVAILWGNDAKQVIPWLGAHQHIASAHPSPLSAHRGFFGSRPFTRANAMLELRGAEPVDWRLP